MLQPAFSARPVEPQTQKVATKNFVRFHRVVSIAHGGSNNEQRTNLWLARSLFRRNVHLVIVQTSSACRNLLLIQQLNKQQILGMRSLSALLPSIFSSFRTVSVKLHLRDGQTRKATTSTAIAAVTPCRRRCDSSTVSRHKQTNERTVHPSVS